MVLTVLLYVPAITSSCCFSHEECVSCSTPGPSLNSGLPPSHSSSSPFWDFSVKFTMTRRHGYVGRGDFGVESVPLSASADRWSELTSSLSDDDAESSSPSLLSLAWHILVPEMLARRTKHCAVLKLRVWLYGSMLLSPKKRRQKRPTPSRTRAMGRRMQGWYFIVRDFWWQWWRAMWWPHCWHPVWHWCKVVIFVAMMIMTPMAHHTASSCVTLV